MLDILITEVILVTCTTGTVDNNKGNPSVIRRLGYHPELR